MLAVLAGGLRGGEKNSANRVGVLQTVIRPCVCAWSIAEGSGGLRGSYEFGENGEPPPRRALPRSQCTDGTDKTK